MNRPAEPFQLPFDVPALNLRMNDWIIPRPCKRAPLRVVRRLGPAEADELLDHLNGIPFVTQPAPEPIDVDQALAVLESDAPLPKEPEAYSLTRNRPLASSRWWHQHKRLNARVNKQVCQKVPVPCKRCGESFFREHIRQTNCRPCIQIRKGG